MRVSNSGARAENHLHRSVRYEATLDFISSPSRILALLAQVI